MTSSTSSTLRAAVTWAAALPAEGCQLYIYFPVLSTFAATAAVSAVFVALYTAFWYILSIARSRALYQSSQKLQESNLHLQKTVNMLRSLQNIYFASFYIDLTQNSCESIFLPQWLAHYLPQNSSYTDMKDALTQNLVLEEYRPMLDEQLSPEATGRPCDRKTSPMYAIAFISITGPGGMIP